MAEEKETLVTSKRSKVSASAPPPLCVWVGDIIGHPTPLPHCSGGHNSGVDIQCLGSGFHSEIIQVFATLGPATRALLFMLNWRGGSLETQSALSIWGTNG